MQRKQKKRGYRRRPDVERLEQRMLLAADLDLMQNVNLPEDVNDDGAVSPVDVLMVVSELNTRDSPDRVRRGFVDVNGDRALSPVDALLVVSRLNRRAPRPDEPQQAPAPPPPLESRTIDGTDNNLTNAEWGSTGSELLRIVSTEYADNVSEPAGDDRLSAREISNLVSQQTEPEVNDRNLSALLWQWGQFIDHDIVLTHQAYPAESFPIDVPIGDASFDPDGTGDQVIPFDRSAFDPASGDSTENPRQQVNSITAFIDASNVYGSDSVTADLLRTFEGGRLKTSEGNLLPLAESSDGTISSFFQAGDIRANEQIGLISLHTLFMREHNRIADRIAADNPELSDEEIYQRARTMVAAEMQAITYNEFLPALLGADAMPAYAGYDPSVNAGISNLFATAIYRFGHSMVSDSYQLRDEAGQLIENGDLELRDAFFNTEPIYDYGLDPILRGLTLQLSQEIDTHVVEDLRSFLFGQPGAGGLDLAALNIQRGRDHGLPDYNQVREDLGLERAVSFADITSDAELQAQLEQAYGDVDAIDVWVGALAEDHLPGASVGELTRAVLVDQFLRLRDGDRFWYQSVLDGPQLRQVEETTLADVIRRNTDITNIQPNVFFVPGARPEGPRADDRLPPPEPGLRSVAATVAETQVVDSSTDSEAAPARDRPPRDGGPQLADQPLETRPRDSSRDAGDLDDQSLAGATDAFFEELGGRVI